MEAINVRIDISTPAGMKLFREIQKHPKVASVEYIVPEEIEVQKTYSVEEVFERLENKLSDLYGVDFKNL